MSDAQAMPEDQRGPARVARSEAELLTLARAVILPTQRYIPSLRQRPKRAAKLDAIGPTAMALLQQTLARGVAAELIRRGGWQTRRTLVDGQPRRGRLWERHPLPPLRFGPASFRLLTWLRAEDTAEPRSTLAARGTMTLADELLHYLAAAQIIHAGGSIAHPAFLRSPLCQLGFPGALASGTRRRKVDAGVPELDFGPLITGDGAVVLEALQTDLARRLVELERAKGELVHIDEIIAIGQAQRQVFDGLFRAIDEASPRRRELASFVAEAARELLARGPERRCPDHRWWTRGLDLRAPLSTRQQAFAASASFLRAVGRLGRWLDEAGVVAHFDEDYEAAQLLLSSWAYLRHAPEPEPEPRPADAVHDQPSMPDAILDRANLLAHQLESLHSLGAPA